MEGRVTVSVALATRNGARFVREQIDSILVQTRPVDEIVVSDDCSDDDTFAIVKDSLSGFSTKTLIRGDERIGIVGNFERALSSCTGDFIALCDQDDIWEPNKIERLLTEIGESSLIYSDYSLIDEYGGAMDERAWEHIPFHGIDSTTSNIVEILIHNSFVLGCTTLIRADLLAFAVPIPDIQGRWHDWWLVFIAVKTGGMRYLPEKLVRYRRHNMNSSWNGSNDKLSNGFRRFSGFCSEQRSAARKEYAFNLLRTIDAMKRANVRLNQEEGSTIAAAWDFAKSLQDTNRTVFRAFYAWKYRSLLMPKGNRLYRMLRVMTISLGMGYGNSSSLTGLSLN